MPVNKVVVQRIESPATGFATMVFSMRETVAEHDVVVELLRQIYHKFPGPWYQHQQELKGIITPQPTAMCRCGDKLAAYCQCAQTIEKMVAIKETHDRYETEDDTNSLFAG